MKVYQCVICNTCYPHKYHRPRDDVIEWKHFPRYWPFVRGIHRSPVNSPLKGQWRGALMFTLIQARTNGWVNNRDAGDLRRYCVNSLWRHCDDQAAPSGASTSSVPYVNPHFPDLFLLLLLSTYFVVLNHNVYFCTMIKSWKLTHFYQATLWGGSPDIRTEN